MEEVLTRITRLAEEAKEASGKLALTDSSARNDALAAMATALRQHSSEIVEANALDMAAAAEKGTSEAILDRLMLDASRVEAMADALESLMQLPDPLGVVDMHYTLESGIELQRVRVPIGVVAIVYEARPNVTADAAGICIKSGNACILRGGSLAQHSNEAITRILASAAEESGMPHGSICAITDSDRSATDALMQLHGIVDVLIPRGGAGLIKHCVETSKVPVIETGTGNCHVYVHESADLNMARDIIINAKCRRYGVCNAAETLLVDKSIAHELLALVVPAFAERKVLMHMDETAMDEACALARTLGIDEDLLKAASEADWATEYLAPEIAIKCVSGVDEAIEHINHFGTHHSEAIVATDDRVTDAFERAIDAAAVYVNASTAFTDGGQFGLGAEIGISTQKLHTRGPFALDALTSYKYVLHGEGQTRE